jgi:hypothetical protein
MSAFCHGEIPLKGYHAIHYLIDASVFPIFPLLPSYYQPMYNDVDEQPDEFLMDLIARYGQTIMNARNDLEK